MMQTQRHSKAFSSAGFVVVPAGQGLARRQSTLLLGLMVIVGLSLSLLAFFAVMNSAARDVRAHDESVFQHHARDNISAFEREVRSQLFALRSLRALFSASEEVTRSEFHRFANTLRAGIPGLKSLQWAPSVTHVDRLKFEARRRAGDPSHPGITERNPDGIPVPAVARELYFPVDFAAPVTGGAWLVLAAGVAITLLLVRYLVALHRHGVELERLNRVQNLLSRCNRTLARAADERALLDGYCRALVEVGGYRFVSVTYARSRQADGLKTVARVGGLRSYADTPSLRACSAAIDQAHPVIHRTPAPCRDNGYLSMIALPLAGGQYVLDVLALYCDRAGAFDRSETALVSELGADLAFGIETLRAREAEKRRVRCLQPGGLGLSMMAERARSVGGETRIRRGFAQGTSVSITVPLAGDDSPARCRDESVSEPEPA